MGHHVKFTSFTYICMFSLLFFITASQSFATTYEAEDADYFGAQSTARATASGGYCLRLFDETGDYVNYQNIAAGNKLVITYSNGLSASSRCSIYVNGVDVGQALFPSTGSWLIFDSVSFDIDIPANADVKLQIDADDQAYNNNESCATQDKIDVLDITNPLDTLQLSSSLPFTNYLNTTAGVGGLGETYRKCNSTDPDLSYMEFTMACEPDLQNYLTLKFWGSDVLTEKQYLYLFDGTTQIGSYGSEEPEIINWSTEPQYSGGFVYVTYMIPASMIDESTSVTLKIAGSQLAVYKAYTHTNSFFEPPEDELQGSPAAYSTPYTDPAGQTIIEHLHEQLELAIDRFLTWQLYGDEWDTWVANGWGPEIMTGSINLHGSKTQGASKDEYKLTWAQRQEAHARVQMTIEVLALAYHAPWSKYYHDPEMIDRVVKALDFLRVAQGSDGGYIELENTTAVWIGGPDRSEGTGSLMGFGLKGAPAAFLALYDEILAAGYLDPNETIDEDDNTATAEVTRKEAYINLFKGVRDYLTDSSNRGHASNQDIVDLFAAYLHDKCLTLLDPTQDWSTSTRQYYFDVCIGKEDGIYGSPWVSDKGISMEGHGSGHGGYCGNYGEHNNEHWMRIALLSGDTEIRDYGLLANQSMAKMRYTGHDDTGRALLRREGWNSWRHTLMPGTDDPGNGIAMAAALYNDPLSLREIQLARDYGQYYLIDYSSYWVHLMSQSSYMMRQVDYLEQALALPDTNERLPFETGEPDFAWADEEAKLIVVKQDDIRFNATMNWRHGLLDDIRHPDYAIANNKVRVHYTDGEKDRLLTVDMLTPFGMHELYLWNFGRYSIGMNASETDSYEFILPPDCPDSAVDLITGEVVDLTSNPILAPRTTIILDFDSPVGCDEYPTGDYNEDCIVDFKDLKFLLDNWLTYSVSGDNGDLSGNKFVNFADYALFMQGWLE